MYESLCPGTQKSVTPLSALTSVYIKRVNCRNCQLYTGVRIKPVFRDAKIKILYPSSY